MFNRNVRGILPKRLTRKINYNTINRAITNEQQSDKKHYDENAIELIQLKESDYVFININNKKPFIHGKIILVSNRLN
jgi:hypothetical protein